MGRTSNADQRLMDAALSLLWGESYGSTTIDDICQRADVRKGSFYYFFESKSDLAVKALDQMWVNFKPQLDEMFAPSVPPVDRIRNHCNMTYAVQVEMKQEYGRVMGCPLCSLGSEIGNRDDAIRDKVREILDLIYAYWVAAIGDALDRKLIEAEEITRKVRCAKALFDGLVAQARLYNDVERIADLADRVCDHLQVKSPHSLTFA